MTIAVERFMLALDQLVGEDGFEFERFANEFLSTEIAQLRPVGGIHDGGRDAFINSSDFTPTVFCQHSVQEDWKAKITDTVKALRSNGHEIRELIYCTNRDIQKHADGIRAKLRRDGVALDIRDRSWFQAVVNGAPGRIAAAEALARKYVDPLLASRQAATGLSPSLSTEEEQLTATYLQLELVGKDPSKGLSKSCIEALVQVALRDATPDNLVSRTAIRDSVVRHLPSSDVPRAQLLADNALDRLVKRETVKYHRKEDAFILSYPHRLEMAKRLASLLASRATLLEETADRADEISKRLGFDFRYDPLQVASDALMILDYQLCERGKLAAIALAGKGDYFARKSSLLEIARDLAGTKPHLLSTLQSLGIDRFLDTIPLVASELASYPTQRLLERLRVTSDAYCLQFALQQTSDVQEALRKIVYGTTLLVDTSVLIPAMSELLLPESQRRLTNLLRGATAIGCRLVVGDDVLNEIDTHLDRLRYRFRHYTERLMSSLGPSAASIFDPALIRAYLLAIETKRFGGSFEDFVDLFKGKVQPTRDLIDFLRAELTVQYDDMAGVRAEIDPGTRVELFERWKVAKPRRSWMDETAFDTLVWHDVGAFMLVERLRQRGMGNSEYAHKAWWLVLDGSAFRFDRERRRSAGAGICVSPEFFARFVSLAPKPVGMASSARELLPVCLEVSELGLVPNEIREEAIATYESMKAAPEYLRRRRLRDLVNAAFVDRDRVADASDTEDDAVEAVGE